MNFYTIDHIEAGDEPDLFTGRLVASGGQRIGFRCDDRILASWLRRLGRGDTFRVTVPEQDIVRPE